MIVYPKLEQGSQEWLAARAGLFTASESAPFLINSGKVAEGARQKLIDRKLAEWCGEVEDGAKSDAMRRGTALEPIVQAQYRKVMSDSHIARIGFTAHDTLPMGASADLVVLDEEPFADATPEWFADHIIGGCETKAPLGHTQIRYAREGKLPEDYLFQVHHSMIIHGTDWWDFYSSCPLVTVWDKSDWKNPIPVEWEAGKIPALYVRTYRDAFTAQLERALIEASNELLRQRAWLENLNAA